MKKDDRESDEFIHLRHKAKSDENYFLTIFDDNGLHTINLNELNKNLLTFGKSEENDIIIASNFVDEQQGYFELTEYGILVVNTSKEFVMVGNSNKPFNDLYLGEGSFVKILDSNLNPIQGVIFIMSINKNLDEWKFSPLQMGKMTLGSNGSCDIILPLAGVSKKHASIYYSFHKVTIIDEGSVNGTYVNGQRITPSQPVPLNNLDFIAIGNSKIILYRNKLYYQIFARGVQLDIIDVVKRVRIKFKTREISSHINMSIKPAEFVAFVGGSGAGKSTFLKCISGVDKPTSGTVFLNGENLYENYETLKYNIGYVPQEDIVYSNLTLHDMLHYAAKLRMPDNTTGKERSERIKEVLDIVQLSELENSYIRQLSGGQRKRASIAVELIADPSLLFLDEPTSGLDPGTERSIMQTLKKMSQMGKTIILVTHNTLNLHLCDKVAFFGSEGRLCFFGEPSEALNFFGVNDFVDIYTLINEDTEKWYKEFLNSDLAPNPVEIQPIKSNKIINKKKSFFKQLITLIKRYIKLISNDFLRVILLFAQAPLIAILLTFVTKEETIYSYYSDTKAILFAIGCACVWFGLLNSVQEICKERVILQKEYMADLKLSTYLLSKFIVQAILAFIQATLLVAIFQAIVGKSPNSILIDGYWDIQIICFLTILSSAALGLFISCLVKNSTLALSIAPIILVPQLVLSGILFKLEGFTEFLSRFILCRWTIEGLGTSVNLNDLTHFIQTINPLAEIEPEAYFTFTTNHMVQVILIIVAMTLILLLASWVALKKNINKNM